jgi:hypothetical protein
LITPTNAFGQGFPASIRLKGPDEKLYAASITDDQMITDLESSSTRY